jgi:hypothetical protein
MPLVGEAGVSATIVIEKSAANAAPISARYTCRIASTSLAG